MSALHTMRRSPAPFFASPSFGFPSLMDELLGNGGSSKRGATHAQPLLTVWGDDDALFVDMELPGLSIDDLELSVLADVLTIKGERASRVPESAELLRMEGTPEQRHGEFERRLQLPCEVQSDSVTAQLRQGVLTIRLPKADAQKPRTIPVQVDAE